jgi:replication initiation and membrane attachment protein DnaB
MGYIPNFYLFRYKGTAIDYDNKLEKYLNYLSDQNIKEISLSKSSRFTLIQFLKNIVLTTYDIYKILKNTAYNADYKNIHKKIKNFISLGLIEKVNQERVYKEYNKLAEHGKVYYRLSSVGLFYLLSDLVEDEVTFENLKLFSKDIFFEIFVYPIL